MIQEFVDAFMAAETAIKERIANDPPGNYTEIVKRVVEAVSDGDYGSIDPERIHQIDDGDYQGTLVFVIAANGYQPYSYWSVKIGYGSCGGCDTLQAIQDDIPYEYRYGDPDEDAEPYVMPESVVTDFWTLMLHVVQGLREI